MDDRPCIDGRSGSGQLYLMWIQVGATPARSRASISPPGTAYAPIPFGLKLLDMQLDYLGGEFTPLLFRVKLNYTTTLSVG